MIKKLIIYIILTILVLSGCASEKTVSQKYGEDVISFHGFELPAALGEPILTENKLKDISDSNRGEMIKTVADLLSYMKKTGNDSDSKSFSTLSCNILFGDYKEAGIVKIDFEDGSEYYEQYFCSDGKYYPINGYAQLTEKKKWMEDYSGDLWSFDKREEMIDAIKTGFPSNGKTVKGVYAIPLYLTSNNGEAFRVDYSSKKYPFYYYCEDVKIPVILGTPQLSEVDISALANNDDFDEVADVISTYPDLVAYKKLKNGDAPFDTDQPYKIAEVVMNMLCYDYDEVGRVIAHQDNNGYTYSYIKNGESFCLIDLFMEDRGVIGVFDSKEEIENWCFANPPAKREVVNVTFDEIKNLESVDAPNGMTLKKTERLGEEVFLYCGYQFPLAYGLPKLSYDEVDALIKKVENGDYEAAKNQISTIPDLACFLKRLGFGPSQKSSLISTGEYNGGNPGNIVYYDDHFCYTVSGRESLMLKEGQCTSTSALFQYILNGDYDEFGYVDLLFFSDDQGMGGYDGHVFAYIKTDGRYILINPASYNGSESIWMEHYDGLKASASTLEELMDYVYESSYPTGDKTASVVAFVYDGSYTRYRVINSRTNPSSNYFVIPEGAILRYNRGFNVDYAVPKHPTTHDFVLGVKVKD